LEIGVTGKQKSLGIGIKFPFKKVDRETLKSTQRKDRTSEERSSMTSSALFADDHRPKALDILG